MDFRLRRSDVEGLSEFDRLQALHESAASCLDGRLHELTPGMRSLTVLFVFDGEINNGGFEACMYNSTGDFTAEAIEAADHVGAREHARIYERFAALALNGDFRMTRAAREQRLEELNDDEIETLEALSVEVESLAPADQILTVYLDQHPEEFLKD